jgi:hypothetical protein
MSNPNQLNYSQQLEHRLDMIKDDLSRFIEFLDENRIMEIMEKETKYNHDAWTHILNIEIACDLKNEESLDWVKYSKQ